MYSLLLTFVLFAFLPCVQSAVTLSQPGSVQLRPSQTLQLTSSISGFSLTSSGSIVSWVHQLPGKGLEWLCRIDWDNDKYYLDSLQNRLTISRDTFKNEVHLEMRGMHPNLCKYRQQVMAMWSGLYLAMHPVWAKCSGNLKTLKLSGSFLAKEATVKLMEDKDLL